AQIVHMATSPIRSADKRLCGICYLPTAYLRTQCIYPDKSFVTATDRLTGLAVNGPRRCSRRETAPSPHADHPLHRVRPTRSRRPLSLFQGLGQIVNVVATQVVPVRIRQMAIGSKHGHLTESRFSAV